MFLSEVDYLLRREQYKDLRRDAARHHLIRIVMPRQPDKGASLQGMAGWIGAQMVKWGSKLQRNNHQRQSLTQQG